ncbi:MAG: class I SAM-dependent methyltransferase [Planctomycetota bacterium]|jgi:SAM-dependent methyltransferase
MSYDFDPHVAEVYDATQTYTDDIGLLRRLIGDSGPWRVREPFCGTGRILIPLALDGHTVVGSDLSQGMLTRCRQKVGALPREVRDRITLRQQDAVSGPWDRGFDLVLLGGNCLYEFSSEADQAACIGRAAACLKSGGFAFVDNNARHGDVTPDDIGHVSTFPTGACGDGWRLEGRSELVRVDVARNLWFKERELRATAPGGETTCRRWQTCTRPVSMEEVGHWLEQHGFEIELLYGNRQGEPFTEESGRAIFWAQKR